MGLRADGVGKGNENISASGRGDGGVGEAVHGIQREGVSLEETNSSRRRGNTISGQGGPVSLDATIGGSDLASNGNNVLHGAVQTARDRSGRIQQSGRKKDG